MAEMLALRQAAPVRWAKVVDHTCCIGCHACRKSVRDTCQPPRLRPAILHSPDGTRRPYWLLRPLKPGREAYQLPGPRFGS